MCEILTYEDFAAALAQHDWKGALRNESLKKSEKCLQHVAVVKGGIWLFMFERYVEARRNAVVTPLAIAA